MARQVYSTRFIQAHGLTGLATYTVPGAFIAILRDLDVFVNATGVVDVFLEGALSQAIVRMHWDPLDDVAKQWVGRQVLMPGETVKVSVTAGPFDAADVSLSGYLLAQ